jgi:hypothetical protein
MRQRYQHDILGTNLRLTELAAAIGIVQLAKLDRNNARRVEIARRYDRALAALPVRTPVTPDGRTHVFHQYTIEVGPERDAILRDLHDAGVGAAVYYPIPVHRQPYVLERGIHADLPVTDRLAATTLSLPVYPSLSPAEQETVIGALTEALARHTGRGAPAGLRHTRTATA